MKLEAGVFVEPTADNTMPADRVTAERYVVSPDIDVHKAYHRYPAEALSSVKVSSSSAWSDSRWVFDGVTVRQTKRTRTIIWDFDLPDGTKLTDPRHAGLLESWRRVVWALYVEPGDGRRRKYESVGSIETGIRYITRWMIEHMVDGMSGLRPAVVADYLEDLAKDKGSGDYDDDGLGVISIRKYIQPLDYIWWAREALAVAGLAHLVERPLGGRSIRLISSSLTARIQGSIPALDDDRFVGIVNGTWNFIAEHAERLIEANNAIADFRAPEMLTDGRARRNTRTKMLHARKIAAEAIGDADGKQLRSYVKWLRTACTMLIQATTGMRIGELVDLKSGTDERTGLPKIIEIQRTADDHYELFFICGRVFKTSASSDAAKWVCGLRPTGSDYLPPPVRAIQILEELDKGWRRLADIEYLYIGFLLTKQGFPRETKNIVSIGAKSASGHQREWVKEILGYDSSRFTTHMWRKTFAQYMVRAATGLLPAISQHFKHVTEAMTEKGYLQAKTGDLELNDLICAERSRQAAQIMDEIATGERPIVGPKAQWMRNEAETIRGRLANRPMAEIRRDIEEIVRDNDFKLWDSEFGYCVFAAEGPKCHNLTGPLGAWARRAPNLAERSPPLCVECPHFAVSGEHDEFWRRRRTDNLAKWEAVKNDGRTPPAVTAQFRERARQAEIVLTWLEAEKRGAS